MRCDGREADVRCCLSENLAVMLFSCRKRWLTREHDMTPAQTVENRQQSIQFRGRQRQPTSLPDMADHLWVDAGCPEKATHERPWNAGARHVLARKVEARDGRLGPQPVAHDTLRGHVETIERPFAMPGTRRIWQMVKRLPTVSPLDTRRIG